MKKDIISYFPWLLGFITGFMAHWAFTLIK